MNYASSKGSLKAVLGKNLKEYYGTCISECSYDEYHRHLTSEAPLSDLELSLRNIDSKREETVKYMRKQLKSGKKSWLDTVSRQDMSKPIALPGLGSIMYYVVE